MSVHPPIYFIGGDKGGVGKSIVSLSLVDYLQQKWQPLLLMDTDTSNPDVWRCYNQKPGIESRLMLLDEADGWIALINFCEEYADHGVVINTAARNNLGVTAYGATLNNALPDLERSLVAFWVINRQRDSLELFRKFLKEFPDAAVHVLRNLHWGSEEKFELYNASNMRATIEERGGLSLSFPDLADRVADNLFSDRLSIAQALQELPIGNRAELRRWRNECEKIWRILEAHDGATTHPAGHLAAAA
jgi:MinD-like ATPase involved in chromosome partitioning or flagellar assembly